MSTSPSVRARIQAAATASNLVVAPTTQQTDVYEREALAICAVGAARNTIIQNIQRRMALELISDTHKEAVFAISQSTKYNQMIVYFKDDKLVSVTLQQDGDNEEQSESD